MAVERTFHCDGPECERHVRTLKPYPPMFLTVTHHSDGVEEHFCGWDCVLRHAGTKEPEIVIQGGEDE